METCDVYLPIKMALRIQFKVISVTNSCNTMFLVVVVND